MINGIILAKKSTWTSRLDLNYLDETSLEKRSQSEDMEIGSQLDQFADYASKETLGEVHISGFLHNRVAENSDGSFTHPANLENEERKRRITREWAKVLMEPVSGRGSRADIIQHRLVFSMSTEVHAACLQNGLNPDQVLHETMKTVMKKFGEKFHPEDPISYAYGFHHDTGNLHAHVALCPRTANGNYVGFSTPRNKATNESQHRDQMGYVRQQCAKENRRWDQIFSDPQKLNQFMTNRHSNRWLLSPRQTRTNYNQALTNRDVSGMQLRRMYDSLQTLHRRMEAVKTAQRQSALESVVAKALPMRGLNPAIRNARRKQGAELALLRKKFCQLRSVYLAHYHAHAQQNHLPINHAYQVSQSEQQRRDANRNRIGT